MAFEVYAAGATVAIHFTTNSAAGAVVAPSGAFGTDDIVLYKDGSATQRSSTSGWTVTSPFDSTTGFHLLSIDLSDNTDAGFYAAGSIYTVLLLPNETVDSQTVASIIGRFKIGTTDANVTQLLGTAWLTPGVAGTPDVNTKLWAGDTIPARNVAGVPLIDLEYWDGVAIAEPATDGIPDVNVKNIVNVAAALDAQNLLKVDAEDWKGGVIPAVNVTGVPKTDVVDWMGSAPNVLQSGRVDSYVGAILAGVIAAGSFAANALDAVWSTATRLLTAGTNIVLAKGTGVTGFNDPSAATNASTLLNTVLTGSTFNVNNSVGKDIRIAAGNVPLTLRTGTAQAGSTANTIKLDSGASSVNGIYVNCVVQITGGLGAGQTATIIGYVGATKIATIGSTWAQIPNNTSTFALTGSSSSLVSLEGTAQAGGAITITLPAAAVAVNSYYDNSLVTILSGTGIGQTRVITGYVGSTQVATVDSAWSVNPDNTSVVAVIPFPGNVTDSIQVPTPAQIVAAHFATPVAGRDLSAVTAPTAQDAYAAALSQSCGSWVLTGTTLTLKNLDGTTARVFTLDSATVPTQRV